MAILKEKWIVSLLPHTAVRRGHLLLWNSALSRAYLHRGWRGRSRRNTDSIASRVFGTCTKGHGTGTWIDRTADEFNKRRTSWNANRFLIPDSLLHTVDMSTVAFVIPSRIRSRLPRFFPARSPTLRLSEHLILTHVTGKKHPKLPRFSTLFKGLARDPKIPSCIY